MRAQRRLRAIWALAVMLAAVFAATAIAASLDFSEAPSSPEAVGDFPLSVAAADLDGDTDQDLAVANFNDDNVTILKNTGNGNFRQPASSPAPAGDQPGSVAAADLDGDGDQDLAVANTSPGTVTILKNKGTGRFRQPASSPEATGIGPDSVVAADLDGDTDQDLAVANFGSDNVTLLENKGSGNFRQPASSPAAAGDGPASVAAADLDGDSDQDLAVVNSNAVDVAQDVTILRNDGDGNFSQPASSPEAAGLAPISVAAADLDGDTDQDLAVANFDSGDVTILKNNSAGNFRERASSPEAAGDRPSSVAAARLDGDADQDLAVANQGNNVTILGNRGTGNFFQPASSPEAAGDTPASVAVADFDGDGDQDLAVANRGSDNVTILKNQ